jgi:hypothetical protein
MNRNFCANFTFIAIFSWLKNNQRIDIMYGSSLKLDLDSWILGQKLNFWGPKIQIRISEGPQCTDICANFTFKKLIKEQTYGYS